MGRRELGKASEEALLRELQLMGGVQWLGDKKQNNVSS
jgi:hypothetical protein